MGDPKKAYDLIKQGKLKFETLNEVGRREVANYIKANRLTTEIKPPVSTEITTPAVDTTPTKPITTPVTDRQKIQDMWKGATPQGRFNLPKAISKAKSTVSETMVGEKSPLDALSTLGQLGKQAITETAYQYKKQNPEKVWVQDKVKREMEKLNQARQGQTFINKGFDEYLFGDMEKKLTDQYKAEFEQIKPRLNKLKEQASDINTNLAESAINKLPSLELLAIQGIPTLGGGVDATSEFAQRKLTENMTPEEEKEYYKIAAISSSLNNQDAKSLINQYGDRQDLTKEEKVLLYAANLKTKGQATAAFTTSFGRTAALGLPEHIIKGQLNKEDRKDFVELVKEARQSSPMASAAGTVAGFVSPGVAGKFLKKAAAPVGKAVGGFVGGKLAEKLTSKVGLKVAEGLGKVSQEVVEGIVAEIPLSIAEITAEDQTFQEGVKTFGENAMYGALLDMGLTTIGQTAKQMWKGAKDAGEDAIAEELKTVINDIDNSRKTAINIDVDPKEVQESLQEATSKLNLITNLDPTLANKTKFKPEPVKLSTIDPNVKVDDLDPVTMIKKSEDIITTNKIPNEIQNEIDALDDEYIKSLLSEDVPQNLTELNTAIQDLEDALRDDDIYMPLNLQMFAAKRLDELKETKSNLRKTYSSLQNTEAISHDLKDIIEETDEKYYSAITNKETWNNAKNYVQSDPEKALGEFLNIDRLPTTEEVARGQALLQHYDRLGKYDVAADVADRMMINGTGLGQAVQAQSILGRLTPEGMIKWANKQFDKVADKKGIKDVITDQSKSIKNKVDDILNDATIENKEQAIIDYLKKETKIKKESIDNVMNVALKSDNPEKAIADILRKDFKIPKMTPELYEYISEKMKVINGMEDGIEKQREIARVVGRITDEIPVSAWKKVSTLQAMSHLLSVPTAVRNIMGNLGSDILNSLGNVIAVPFDKAISAVKTGKRTVALPKLKAKAMGFYEGGSGALKDAMEGIDRDLANISKYNLPTKTFKRNSDKILERALSKLETALEIELKVPDEAFKEGTRRDALEQMMKLAGVDKPTKEMLEQAEQEALYRTFQDDSLPAKMLQKLKETLNIAGTKEFGLGDLVVKYTRVPGNIMSRTVDFSPAGYLKVLVNAAEQNKKGLLNQRQLALGLGNATAGTSLIAMGAYLRRKGVIITPDTDKDFDKMQLLRGEGLGGYQINIDGMKRLLSGEDPSLREGDDLTTYNWMQPLSTTLTIGSRVSDSIEEEKPFPTTVRDSLGASVEEILDLPTLQVINQMFYESQKKDSDPLDVFMVIPASGATGFVPAPVRQVASGADPYLRDVSGDTILEKTQRRVMSSIPGLRQQLPEKYSGLGDKVENQKNLLQSLLSPSTITKYKPDKTINKLAQIEELTGETTQYPDYKPSSRLKLPFEKRQEYQKVYGTTIAKLYDRILSDRDVENMSQRQLDALLNKLGSAKRRATKQAKKEVLGGK